MGGRARARVRLDHFQDRPHTYMQQTERHAHIHAHVRPDMRRQRTQAKIGSVAGLGSSVTQGRRAEPPGRSQGDCDTRPRLIAVVIVIVIVHVIIIIIVIVLGGGGGGGGGGGVVVVDITACSDLCVFDILVNVY